MKQFWKRGLAAILAGCMMALSVPVMGVVAEEEEILENPPAPAMPDDDDPISTSTGILSTTTYSTTTTTTANTSYSTPSYTMTGAPIITNVSYMTTAATSAVQETNPVETSTALETSTSATAKESFEYSILPDGTIQIDKYNGSDSIVVIPSLLDGQNVTVIGYRAFAYNESVSSVTIPEGVTIIDNEAFLGCENLASIEFPDSLIKINNEAFCQCLGLESIVIPENVEYIGREAFNCAQEFVVNGQRKESKLSSITIKNPDCEIYDASDTFRNGSYYMVEWGGEEININFYGTFSGYTNSTAHTYAEKYNVKYFQTLNNLIRSSGDYKYFLNDDRKIIILEYCGEATDVIIPEELDGIAVTEIWEKVFYNSSITSITIPESVKKIHENAISKKTIIYGYSHTAAHIYAEENGILFVSLGEALEPITTETTTTTTTETTTTETNTETTTETTTTETIPRPEIIRKGDVTITYTDGGTASMGTDNDGVSIRKNIYHVWGNSVKDIDTMSPVNDKITIEFSIEGIGDRTANRNEDGTDGEPYEAWIQGSVAANGSWNREDDTAPCAHVPITGDGTYTVVWNLNEGSDNIDCLVLQTNINLYEFEGGTSENFGGVTITIHSITTFSGWSFGDINKDSEINSSDASYVLSAAAAVGLEQPSGLEDAAFARADVNNDGTVNAADASIILVYSAAQGLTTDVLNLDDFIPVNG